MMNFVFIFINHIYLLTYLFHLQTNNNHHSVITCVTTVHSSLQIIFKLECILLQNHEIKFSQKYDLFVIPENWFIVYHQKLKNPQYIRTYINRQFYKEKMLSIIQ